MKVIEQEYRDATISELTLHPENPRQGDVGAIFESIERNGFYGALTVQRSTGFILTGNHRVQAAQQAGALTVPILEVDCDDATATRIMLADNRTNDLASYNDPALASLLERIASAEGGVENLRGTGYDGDDLDTLLKDLAANDAKVERGSALAGLDVSMAEPLHEAKRHDVWRLGGKHTLCVCDVNHDWSLYTPFLTPGCVFAPYPSPMLAIVQNEEATLVMVQPHRFMAGHVLDKYASRYGEDSVERQAVAA